MRHPGGGVFCTPRQVLLALVPLFWKWLGENIASFRWMDPFAEQPSLPYLDRCCSMRSPSKAADQPPHRHSSTPPSDEHVLLDRVQITTTSALCVGWTTFTPT